MNVPRNVSVLLEKNDLLATWEKPISAFPKECFEYEFSLVNLKSGNKQVIASLMPKYYTTFLSLRCLSCTAGIHLPLHMDTLQVSKHIEQNLLLARVWNPGLGETCVLFVTRVQHSLGLINFHVFPLYLDVVYVATNYLLGKQKDKNWS